jgi:hypothetical protein
MKIDTIEGLFLYNLESVKYIILQIHRDAVYAFNPKTWI